MDDPQSLSQEKITKLFRLLSARIAFSKDYGAIFRSKQKRSQTPKRIKGLAPPARLLIMRGMKYIFADFQLDTHKLVLSEKGSPISLEPQVFSVIQFLIENRDRVVLKEDLVSQLWKGRVISDSALSSAIKSARKALGDNGREQRLIKTVHSVGFRFVSEVLVEREAKKIAYEKELIDQSRENLISQKASIVVLPLESAISGEGDIAPRGITHDVIVGLSKNRWLKVIAQGTAFKLNQAQLDRPSIKQLIAAKYYVKGNIETQSKALHIYLELGLVEDQSVIWADTISAPTGEANKVREDVVSIILSTLQEQISTNESNEALLYATESLNAWQSYHRGIAHLNRFTKLDTKLAKDYFKRSLTLDPMFARAHAGYSAAEFQNAFNKYGQDSLKSVGQAVKAAEKSVEIDRLDPFANFVMGRSYWLRGQTSESLPWLERSVKLNPNYAQGYYALGLASLMSDNDLRGYKESELAESLSPLDPFLYGFYGIRTFSFLADGDYDSARLWSEKAALQPEALVVMDLLAAACCELVKDFQKREFWLAKAKSRNPNINREQFFIALPFSNGKVKRVLSDTFVKIGI